MTAFTVHYMKPDFFRDGNMGVDWLKEHGPMPTLAALDKTHTELKTFDLELVTFGGNMIDALERVYAMMQGENWSPNGEARPLIQSKGLRHTSMSVGDAVVVEGKLWLADRWGFKEIESAKESA